MNAASAAIVSSRRMKQNGIEIASMSEDIVGHARRCFQETTTVLSTIALIGLGKLIYAVIVEMNSSAEAALTTIGMSFLDIFKMFTNFANVT